MGSALSGWGKGISAATAAVAVAKASVLEAPQFRPPPTTVSLLKLADWPTVLLPEETAMPTYRVGAVTLTLVASVR